MDARVTVLSILTHYISYRSYSTLWWTVVRVIWLTSEVLQDSVLGPLLFIQHNFELFSILENKLIGYVDESCVMAVVPSPCVRVTVAESLKSDLFKVSECMV